MAFVLSPLTSCDGDHSIGGPSGQVSGRVLAGPTCPVEQPGVLNCEPKPVQGIVQFRKGDRVVGSVVIDAVGDFAIEIPVGTYTVTVDTGDNIFPTCSKVEVEVRANADSVAEIFCDTGIR